MMLKKTLTSSCKKILKAIKNASRTKLNEKLEQKRIQAEKLAWLEEQRKLQESMDSFYYSNTYWAWSALWEQEQLKGADLVDAYSTLQKPIMIEQPTEDCCCCCCCYYSECDLAYSDERDENQLNENLENEMLY